MCYTLIAKAYHCEPHFLDVRQMRNLSSQKEGIIFNSFLSLTKPISVHQEYLLRSC